jgi:hypothetical protein
MAQAAGGRNAATALGRVTKKISNIGCWPTGFFIPGLRREQKQRHEDADDTECGEDDVENAEDDYRGWTFPGVW